MEFYAETEVDIGQLEWKLENSIPGVVLSGSGILTVENTVDVSNNPNKEHWVEVIVKVGEIVDSLPVVILRKPDFSKVLPLQELDGIELEERISELERVVTNLKTDLKVLNVLPIEDKTQ